MKRFVLAPLFLVLIACLPCVAFAGTPVLVDTFDSSPLGVTPTGWSLARTVAGTSANVIAGTPAGNRLVDLHDDNAPSTTTNNTLSRTFTAVASGRVIAQFDVYFPQTTAAFGTRLTNGGVATSGSSWATCLLFEGNIAYAPGASSGKLSYQTAISTYASTPLATYSANTWYTVRIEVNIDTKSFKIFFGPKDQSLTEITPAGGVPFITGGTSMPVSQIGGVSFFSSIKDGDTSGDLKIDNVNISIGDPEPILALRTIAESRAVERGAMISLSDRIVTADTSGSTFYIEDDDPGVSRVAGIRVRAATSTVNEGDRVDVVGRIVQSSEGNPAAHAGEREIVAQQVMVKSTRNPVPKPIFLRNAYVGGGWFGPMELLAEGYEPVIKGVWPLNAWGNAGVSSWVGSDNSLAPLANTGLLVTVAGKVIEPTVYDSPGTNYDFYIDDGSLENDGWFATPAYADEIFHPRGLRTRVTDPSMFPSVPLHYGDIVRITGIAGAISCNDLGRSSSRNVRVVRPRKAQDIQVVQRANTYTMFDAQGNLLVNNKPFFPIGLYLYWWGGDVLSQVLNQGFNTVIYAVTPADLPTLRANNIYTIPYGQPEWVAVKDDPQILSWYLTDEPEGWGKTPAMEREMYESLRSADPTRPVGICHFNDMAIGNYRHSADYVLTDNYPINSDHTQRITTMSDLMDIAHSVHGPNFPVWPVIQIFGGPTTENGQWGTPTPAEVRCMTYLALVHGARAMMFFSYQPGLVDTWAAAKAVISELKQLSPFYCLPSNALSISSSDPNIHCRCIQIGDSGLVILVNTIRSPVSTTITIPNLPVTGLTLPIENGSIPVTNGQFNASFDSLGVHVYQWGEVPQIP